MKPSAAGPVLILGGGLLGSHSAQELIGCGIGVTVFTRSVGPLLRDLLQRGSGVEVEIGEIGAGESLVRLMRRHQRVLMFAGSSTPAVAEQDPVDGLRRSVVPALAALDAVRRAGGRRIAIAVSGGTAYGRVTSTPTEESHPLRPTSFHGLSSVVIERYAAFFAEFHGLETVVLRYSNVYGPGQRVRGQQGVIAAWCQAIAKGDTITLMGSGSVERDFVYASDAAGAAIAALMTPRPAPAYNVGGGRSYTLDDVLVLLARVTGRKVEVTKKPRRGVDLPVTELDVSRIRSDTGWQPTTNLEEGLGLMWRWQLTSPGLDGA